MSSFKSGLRYSYRLNRTSSKDGEVLDDPETKLTDYKKRGSSLPANCSSISVKLLPSLPHSATDPDIRTNKMIPKDVIETDYLFQPNHLEENQRSEEKSNIRNEKSLKDSISSQNTITERNSNLNTDVCRELQKAFLEGLGQRVISRRGRSNGAGSSYNLLLNADLLDRVSLDIVRMSEREPSGLSGCRLRTLIERQHSADMDLGCVRVDQDAEETFEIVLSLKECQKSAERRNQGLIGNVSALLSNIFSNSVHRGGRGVEPVEVYVSDAYQLEKIKLRKYFDSQKVTDGVGLCV